MAKEKILVVDDEEDILELVRYLSSPILVVIDGVDEIVRRLAGAPRETPDRTEEMEREILDAVSQAETSGAVDESERAMIKSVMVLDETSAGEIMTPRTDMIGVDSSADYEHVRSVVSEAGFSRIPVYQETMDNIVGVLHAKALLRAVQRVEGNLERLNVAAVCQRDSAERGDSADTQRSDQNPERVKTPRQVMIHS